MMWKENCKKGTLWKARKIGPKFVNIQLKQFYTQADSEQGPEWPPYAKVPWMREMVTFFGMLEQCSAGINALLNHLGILLKCTF